MTEVKFDELRSIADSAALEVARCVGGKLHTQHPKLPETVGGKRADMKVVSASVTLNEIPTGVKLSEFLAKEANVLARSIAAEVASVGRPVFSTMLEPEAGEAAAKFERHGVYVLAGVSEVKNRGETSYRVFVRVCVGAQPGTEAQPKEETAADDSAAE